MVLNTQIFYFMQSSCFSDGQHLFRNRSDLHKQSTEHSNSLAFMFVQSTRSKMLTFQLFRIQQNSIAVIVGG